MPWTVISDATLEVGKALRALTMRNLRDNFAALANGDAGAPQIQTAAIAASAVTTAKIATGAVAAWSASLGTGEVGTYAFLAQSAATLANITAGTAYAGSGLVYSGMTSSLENSGGTPSGTWRAMGARSQATTTIRGTVFLRIS